MEEKKANVILKGAEVDAILSDLSQMPFGMVEGLINFFRIKQEDAEGAAKLKAEKSNALSK